MSEPLKPMSASECEAIRFIAGPNHSQPTIDRILLSLKQREEAMELVKHLVDALLAQTRGFKDQHGEPCWCRTIAQIYCVGQDECRKANWR